MVGVRIGSASIVAATALLGVCFAGAPLYVSSSATAALHVGLDRTCASDVGLTLSVPAQPNAVFDAQLAELTRAVAHVQRATNAAFATGRFTVVGADGVVYPASILAKDGDDEEVGIVSPITTGEVAVQAYLRARAHVDVGSVVAVVTSSRQNSGATSPPLSLTVAKVVDNVPFSPEQSYWCGFRVLLRPNGGGDPPNQWLIMNMSQMVQEARSLGVYRTWELRVDDHGLTRDDAVALVRKFRQITDSMAPTISAAFANERSQGFNFSESAPATPQLGSLVRQANTVSSVVAKTVEPIRLSGAVASLLLLVGAGVLVARQRRRDLRLRMIRGESPWALAASSMRTDLLSVVLGGLLGFGLCLVAVRSFGPSSLLEASAVRSAALLSVVAGVLSSCVVGGACAFSTQRTVDARARRLRRRYPFEWVAVVLIVVSYRRLDRLGGVQLVGADAKGGDPSSQAFP